MTYQEATTRLLELAGEKYCSIGYGTRGMKGKYKDVCCLYIEDAGATAEAQTWEIAFDMLATKRGTVEVPADQGPVMEEVKEVA